MLTIMVETKKMNIVFFQNMDVFREAKKMFIIVLCVGVQQKLPARKI